MREVCLYWPNGNRKRRCFFRGNVRIGVDQMWNEEGQLVDEGSYEEGEPIGVHRRWDGSGRLIEEISYLDQRRFDLRQWDREGNLRVEAIWEKELYREKVWDRFQGIWIEKEGFWNGNCLIYR